MPSVPAALDALLDHLRRERVRLGASNVFLFGPAGDPFWAAWMPISRREVAILSDAIDALEAANAHRTKPYIGHDDERRYSFGALDTHELYFVLVMDVPAPDEAEARVADFRQRLREVALPLPVRAD